MSAPPPPARNRVDRMLDRIKDNRLMAVLIVFGIVLAALASFTDSVKKLADVLPSAARVSMAGEWRSQPANFYNAEDLWTMHLQLREVAGGRLAGTVSFFDPDDRRVRAPLELRDGVREGGQLSFWFEGNAVLLLAAGGSQNVRESLDGELKGDRLVMVYQRPMRGTVDVVLQRVAPAAAVPAAASASP